MRPGLGSGQCRRRLSTSGYFLLDLVSAYIIFFSRPACASRAVLGSCWRVTRDSPGHSNSSEEAGSADVPVPVERAWEYSTRRLVSLEIACGEVLLVRTARRELRRCPAVRVVELRASDIAAVLLN